jgi:hypothetical protein
MNVRALTALALLAGCAGPIEGTWIGEIECQAIPYDFTYTLARDSGKTYLGSGTQERSFTSVEGNTTDEKIEYDLTLTLASNGGAQELSTEIVCTYEDIVEFGAGGGDPTTVAQGCTPRRFDGWVFSWDGEDVMTVNDPRGCAGDINRR